MKLKKLKRGLSALLAGLITVSSVGITSSFLVVADNTDYSNIFTYQAATGYYALKGLVDNYQDLLGGITEITLPETYNDLPCALNASTFQNNTYFTKVTVPSSYEALNGFNGCSSIKEIVLLNEEQVSFKLSCLKNCTALKTLKIYASSLASNPTVATFTNVPTTAVAYVKNDTVKEQLVNWPGTIVVDPNMGGEETTNYTALDTAIADGEAVDTTKYTDDSVKALTDAIVAGKAVKENADATQDDVDSAVQTLVAAIDALEELPTASSDVYLWTGTYSRSGGLDTTSITDNMTVTSSSGYITFKGIDLSNMLKPYIEVVFDANDSTDTLYVSTSSWSTVINSSSDEVTTASLENFASSTAFIVTTNNKSGTYGIIKSVKFYDAAYVAPTDFTELESAITEAEAIDTTNYTEDSVKALTDAIAAAKTVLANADATQDEVDAATKAITDAIAGLEELPAASSDVYLWTGTYSRSSGLDTTSITDNMTVTSSSGYITFKGIDLSNMLKPYIEVVFDANDSTDTLYVSTSSWSTVINSSSDEVTTASLENFASSTAFIVTTNNKSGTYGIIKSVKFYDAAVSPKTVVATYEIGAENASDVIAAIYDDGSVVISGTGAMTDYTLSGNGGPWHDDYASIITTVEIGEGVTNIGNYAFFDFGSLVDVSLPSTLTSVGDGAFRKCTALTSVEIPEGVTSLGNGAFYSCSSLTSINIPNGVTSMPGNTFNGCTSLTGDIYIPSAITLLVSTFNNCSDPNLNVYIMGESVKIDSNTVFNNFTGTVYVYDLTTYNNVYIRYKNVFLIGEKGLNLAITKAEALDSSIYTDESWTILETALTAAKSVAAKENATETEISEALSSLNSAIDSLVYGDHGALVGGPWDISLNGDYSVVATLYNDQTLVISGTGATKNCNSSSYQNTNTCPWYSYASSITGIVVTEGVTSVGDYLFSGYSKINSVELASSVTSIGTYTFRSCVLLENVTLSNSLQSIGSAAFLDCSALKNLYFPGSLTTIGQQAFGRCTSLISVEFDDASNPSFGIMVFNGCSGLKSVKLSSKLTSIGQSMFYDCTALETISFPEELTSIGGSAFYNCNLSGDITIPAGVTAIPLNAFRNNKSENLNFYVLGEVTSVESGAFGDCAGKIYVYSDTTYNIIAASNHGTAEVIYIGTDLSTVNLKAAIADGEAVVTAKYTDDSVKTLTDAITTGKTVLENTNATQEDIDAATQAIENAIAALEYKPGVTGSIAGTILVSDKDNSTEMTVTAVSADGTETSVTATSMGTYTLEGLEAGEYTLTISGGKYAPRTYEVTVEAVDLAFDVELNPLGDINGDGAITTADVGMANSHAKGVQSLEGYKFVCADVKIDGSITTADVGMINSHAKSVSTLW